MPVPDKDLDRMVQNLAKAFNAAASGYEAYAAVYGVNHDSVRKRAEELATVSQAYLEAVREQDARLDAKERPKLVKPPKTL